MFRDFVMSNGMTATAIDVDEPRVHDIEYHEDGSPAHQWMAYPLLDGGGTIHWDEVTGSLYANFNAGFIPKYWSNEIDNGHFLPTADWVELVNYLNLKAVDIESAIYHSVD